VEAISFKGYVPLHIGTKMREDVIRVSATLNVLASRISAIKAAEEDLSELFVLQEAHERLQIDHGRLQDEHSSLEATLHKAEAANRYLRNPECRPTPSPVPTLSPGNAGDRPPSTSQPMEVDPAGKVVTLPPVRVSSVREEFAPQDHQILGILKEMAVTISELKSEVARLSSLAAAPPPVVRAAGRSRGEKGRGGKVPVVSGPPPQTCGF